MDNNSMRSVQVTGAGSYNIPIDPNAFQQSQHYQQSQKQSEYAYSDVSQYPQYHANSNVVGSHIDSYFPQPAHNPAPVFSHGYQQRFHAGDPSTVFFKSIPGQAFPQEQQHSPGFPNLIPVEGDSAFLLGLNHRADPTENMASSPRVVMDFPSGTSTGTDYGEEVDKKPAKLSKGARSGRACVQCRARKMKCQDTSKGPLYPCVSCVNVQGRVCQDENPNTKERRARGELELLEATQQQLLRQLERVMKENKVLLEENDALRRLVPQSQQHNSARYPLHTEDEQGQQSQANHQVLPLSPVSPYGSYGTGTC